jgi:hypothetical protein
MKDNNPSFINMRKLKFYTMVSFSLQSIIVLQALVRKYKCNYRICSCYVLLHTILSHDIKKIKSLWEREHFSSDIPWSIWNISTECTISTVLQLIVGDSSLVTVQLTIRIKISAKGTSDSSERVLPVFHGNCFSSCLPAGYLPSLIIEANDG